VAGMANSRQRLGDLGERLVAERLRSLGYAIVDRNVRTPGIRGEIDLIATDGRDLVFVEVKTRRAGGFAGPETPALAVDRPKQARLRALAGAWLARNRGRLRGFRELRFDVVGLRFDAADRLLELEHIRGAF
jgi:putative endonuclease